MTPDRRDLIRQYKETPRTAGVGLIRNSSSGKVLLIAGVDLPALFTRHRAQLRMGGHPNRALQADWNALGADAFVFEVADTLPPPEGPGQDISADLKALEALWLEKLAPWTPAGYHSRPWKPRSESGETTG